MVWIDDQVFEDLRIVAIKSKMKWLEKGKTTTKELFTTIRKRKPHLLVSKLEKNYWKAVNIQKGIVKCYKNVFAKWTYGISVEKTWNFFIKNLKIWYFEHTKNTLTWPIKEREMLNVANKLAKTKTLSLNGTIMEFFQKMWGIVGKEYLLMVQKSIQKLHFPPRMMKGSITLSLKGGEMKSLWVKAW